MVVWVWGFSDLKGIVRKLEEVMEKDSWILNGSEVYINFFV